MKEAQGGFLIGGMIEAGVAPEGYYTDWVFNSRKAVVVGYISNQGEEFYVAKWRYKGHIFLRAIDKEGYPMGGLLFEADCFCNPPDNFRVRVVNKNTKEE